MRKLEPLAVLTVVIVGCLFLGTVNPLTRPFCLLFLVLLSAPYWLVPLFVWLNNRFPVPQWDVPDPRELDELPGGARTFFESSDEAFSELGFSLVAVLKQAGLVRGYSTWVTLYVKRSEMTRAVAHAWVTNNEQPLTTTQLAFYFVTRFKDGREVETANGRFDNPLPTVEQSDSRRFPDIDDPRRLYSVHLLRTAPYGNAPRDFPAEGDEVAYLNRSLTETFESRVGVNYLSAVEPGRIYRPTLKGAYLMTWKRMPPWNLLARARAVRENREFLAEHGMSLRGAEKILDARN